MRVRGQSAVEWLMTHAWSILVVLSVSAVLFYAGVFEAVARPRFEGLDAAGLRPIPEQVQLYSDGVLVFTVLNTRPYSYTLEWVEVAPIANREDVIRTNLNSVLRSNQIEVFEVNASNLLGSIMEASIISLQDASAEEYVSFYVSFVESYTVGGRASSHTVGGKGINIIYTDEPSWGIMGLNPCVGSCVCECTTDSDCPLACQICYNISEDYDGFYGPGPGWDLCDGKCIDDCPRITDNGPCNCKRTAAHLDGECECCDECIS